jgi:hypothetical protein
MRTTTRKSSRVVSEARSAAFSPPSSDILFDLSPVPPNPLGEGRCIKTAGALIIGYVILWKKKTPPVSDHTLSLSRRGVLK